MTRDQIIERVARLIDPDIWDTDLPVPTRSDVQSFHQRRKTSAQTATAIVDMIAGEIEALQAECLEQARLNGKGAEREAALMARVEALQAENERLKAEVTSLRRDNNKLLLGFHAAIQRPMGVVPAGFDNFYDATLCEPELYEGWETALTTQEKPE